MTPTQLAEAAINAAETAADQLSERTVYVDVTFHRPGVKRKGDLDKVETQADKTQLGLTKTIVTSESYRELCKVARDFRKWLKKRDVWNPLRRGIVRVPVTLVEQIWGRLDRVEQSYSNSAEAFLQEYPQLVEKAKIDLQNQFNAENYPTVERLRKAFWVERRIFDLARPSARKLGNVASAENKRAAKEIQDDALMVKAALRMTLQGLVGHLAERLSPDEDGNKKQFGNTTYGKLAEFLELFDARNVVNDTDLAELAGQARKLLEGRTVDDFKANTDDAAALRAEVSEKLTEIKTSLDGLIEDMDERLITLAGGDNEEDE